MRYSRDPRGRRRDIVVAGLLSYEYSPIRLGAGIGKLNNNVEYGSKCSICTHIWDYWSFLDGSAVKNSSANAEDTGEVDSILGWEDPLEEGMATHSTILAWRIPWAEEPGG